ncbi:serine hydrolase [Flavobacterium sp.]|uniref:serine hydrolase n=1 Tax=Flavobacterium sp. TaxID=239 RepID=UPI0025BA6462|nr:serine hydrolase [Flavobacterium sp.]
MDKQFEINDFSGTVIVMKKDSVLLRKAYGLANREFEVKNSVETKFVLASVTKYFTAIAIMQLVEQQKLSVDDKLSKYFPAYPNGEKVTIHMLLTHTAGLPLDFDDLYMNSTTISKDSANVILMRKPYLFEPGTACKYSNVGYFLLGQIIEKASGKSYADFLKQHIFDKARMTGSGICNNDSIVRMKADIYYKENGKYAKNPYLNWNLNVGHDGAYSTVDDLYKLDRAMYGNSILSSESRAKMETKYNSRFPDGGFFDSYGYGIIIDPYYNHGHSLRTHSGGFIGVMTTFDRYPDDDLFIAVLSNNGSESHMVSYALSAIVFGIPVEMPYIHKAIEIAPTKLTAFAGEYQNVKIIASDDKLFLNTLDDEFVPESQTKFFRKGNPDRTFEFLMDRKGKVTSVLVGKGGVKEKKSRLTKLKR